MLIHPQLSKEANNKLNKLLDACEEIRATHEPDYVDGVLIRDSFTHPRLHTKAGFMGAWFREILSLPKLSKLSIKAIEESVPTVSDDPIEAYYILNAPAHLVRNYLIRNNIDVREEEKGNQ